MRILSAMVRDNRFTPEEAPQFERKLFFEGSRRRPYLERFGVLLSLAAIIATMGVLADSTATVIGAMIIAPLMTPIMATAAALVVGRMKRALRSTLIVAASVLGVIALSWFLGEILLLAGGFLAFTQNTQITSRTSPDLIDLVAALAAGAAGAFAMSRDDIADSLPGVAISISLVPPLCVVGISLSHSEGDAALGALLLFVTNYLSILLAGGGVLALLGLSRASNTDIDRRARRDAFTAIAVGVLIVAIPLAVTFARISNTASTQRQARTVVEAWSDEAAYIIRDVHVDFLGRKIAVVVSGSGEAAASFPALIDTFESTLNSPYEVQLEIIGSQTLTHAGATSDQPD